MWIKLITASPEKVKVIESCIQDLNSMGFFGALLEWCTRKNAPLATQRAGDYALRAAYSDGYTDCLKDIYEFRERFVDQPIPRKDGTKNADFGAKAIMLEAGDIKDLSELDSI